MNKKYPFTYGELIPEKKEEDIWPSIIKYINMYKGEMSDRELLDDIINGAYLDEPECQDLLEENDEHADRVYRLCGIIDCYLMGSESLEKIDVSARKLLAEVRYEA